MILLKSLNIPLIVGTTQLCGSTETQEQNRNYYLFITITNNSLRICLYHHMMMTIVSMLTAHDWQK